MSSPSGVRGGAPAENENGFWRILKATERSFLYLGYMTKSAGDNLHYRPLLQILGDVPLFPRDLRPCVQTIVEYFGQIRDRDDYSGSTSADRSRHSPMTAPRSQSKRCEYTHRGITGPARRSMLTQLQTLVAMQEP